MGWERRIEPDDLDDFIPRHLNYDPTSSLYTIKLHYGGKFARDECLGDVIYVEGEVALFDCVDSDEMSLIEIKAMAEEVGCTGPMLYYYSCTEPSYTTQVRPLVNDSDVIHMFHYEKHRIVGVFVEQTDNSYEENLWVVTGKDRVCTDECDVIESKMKKIMNKRKQKKPLNKKEVQAKKKRFEEFVRLKEKAEKKEMDAVRRRRKRMSESETVASEIEHQTGVRVAQVTFVDDYVSSESEHVPYMGVEGNAEDHDNINAESGSTMVGTNGEEATREDIGTKNGEEATGEDMDINEISESDCEVSCEDDSDLSEYYVDSEGNYEIEEDEADYDNFVDHDSEWGGIGQSEPTIPLTRSMAIITSFQKVSAQRPIVPPHTYEGRKVFNPDVDMLNVEFSVNTCFNSRRDVINAIKKHALDNKKDIKFPLRQEKKVQAICKHLNCPWKIYVSRQANDNTWVVRTLGGDHRCPRPDKIALATPQFIYEVCGEDLLLVPSATKDEMQALILRKTGIDVTDTQMYRIRALLKNHKAEGGQYNLAHRYGAEVRRSNPGSTVKVKPRQYVGHQIFERMYVCFGAMKLGFLDGCRNVLLLDGCHMNNVFGGVLLTAVGLDPNNGMYPIAYCVAEKERYESWRWFLEILVDDLGIEKNESHKWTVMSDKQKGLVKAVEDLLPYCEHRFCVYHLYSNFKQLHKGLSLKLLLWKAAKATRPADFEQVMKEIRQADPKAFKWLATKPAAEWSKSYFKVGVNSDLLLNNISETQNKSLLKARKKAVIDIFEDIRLLGMKRIAVRRKQMLAHTGEICPRIEGLLLKNRDMSNKFTAVYNGNSECQVYGNFPGQVWAVNVRERTCTCRRWQLTGIPCAHGISGILKRGLTVEEHVADCYKKSTYLKVCSHYICPIAPSDDEWPSTNITCELHPPEYVSAGGRPKKYARKKQEGKRKKKKFLPRVENGRLTKHGIEMRCSNCRLTGHNKKGCPGIHTIDPNVDENELDEELEFAEQMDREIDRQRQADYGGTTINSDIPCDPIDPHIMHTRLVSNVERPAIVDSMTRTSSRLQNKPRKTYKHL